jgi:hypothetical protein
LRQKIVRILGLRAMTLKRSQLRSQKFSEQRQRDRREHKAIRKSARDSKAGASSQRPVGAVETMYALGSAT